MYAASPRSMDEVMTTIKWCCDFAHVACAPLQCRQIPSYLFNTKHEARQKALQALDALANKSLVVKITRSDHKRGKVIAFQPIETRRCA